MTQTRLSIVLMTLLAAPLAHAKSTLRDTPVTAPQQRSAEPASPAGLPGVGVPGTVGAPGAPGTSGGAGALPEVPLIGDEPLPDWKPPEVHVGRRQALFLSLAPEIQRAQRMRQAGMWLASFGGVALLAGGIVEAAAIDLAGNIGTSSAQGGNVPTGRFDPAEEDKKDAVHAGALSLFAVGGALAASGMTLFIVGQYRIKRWHVAHPADPLPPLSGY
jgi:hypothetical protein